MKNAKLIDQMDDYKWLYRSSFRIVEVRRNGCRISTGSGKFQTSYTYSNEALEQHRGRRVVCFLNEHDPETDAVIYTLKNGRQDKMICVASLDPRSNISCARKSIAPAPTSASVVK